MLRGLQVGLARLIDSVLRRPASTPEIDEVDAMSYQSGAHPTLARGDTSSGDVEPTAAVRRSSDTTKDVAPGNRPPQSYQVVTILVAEDEDRLRRAVLRVLTKAGFSTVEAQNESGLLGALRAQGNRIDVLLFDAAFSGVIVQELLQQALCLRPGIKIIVAGESSQRDTITSLGVPVSHFVTKPYRLDKLVELITTIVADLDRPSASATAGTI